MLGVKHSKPTEVAIFQWHYIEQTGIHTSAEFVKCQSPTDSDTVHLFSAPQVAFGGLVDIFP